jgi:hypothetical protein
LYINYTNIEILPDGLTVSGDLCLGGTKIKELPKRLEVGGTLYIRDTQIKTIKRSLLKHVKGSIYRDDTTKIVD